MPSYKKRYAAKPRRVPYAKYKARKKKYAPVNARVGSKYGKISSVLMTQPGSYMPDRMCCKLKFSDVTYVRNNAAAVGCSWRYRTSAYDPDPLLSTGAIPGFAELAAFYGTYRVSGMAIKLKIVNLETHPVKVTLVPTVEDKGNNYIANDMSDYMYSKTCIISPTGGQDKGYLSGYISQKKLFGSKQASYDNQFAAAVTTNPVVNTYWNVQVIGLSAVLVNGVAIDCVLTQYIQFYGKKALAG